jgi:hypothetical protein
VEAGVAITAGVIASSIALVGFGLDSVIDFFSAAVGGLAAARGELSLGRRARSA